MNKLGVILKFADAYEKVLDYVDCLERDNLLLKNKVKSLEYFGCKGTQKKKK
jgi:hypothetical protein